MAATRRGMARKGEPGYRVDVWGCIGAIVTEDPRLSHDALRLAAAAVRYLFVKGADPELAPLARLAPEDPDTLIGNFRELYHNGYIGVEDGRAYLTVPICGPFGNVVDRLRVSSLSTAERDQLIRHMREGL
jgi:hypothetical protein